MTSGESSNTVLSELEDPCSQVGMLPQPHYVCVCVHVCSVAKMRLTLCEPIATVLQASLSFTISQSLLKCMSIESVTPSHHLILCCPFASCLQSFPASGSFPMNRIFESGIQSIGALASGSVLPGVLIWLISFRIDWFSNPQMQYF